MRGFVRRVLGQVGLVEVVTSPVTLFRPCVATLGGPCVATLGSPFERIVLNLFIISIHCILPLTDGGSSIFILFSRSAAASAVLPSSYMVGVLQCCGNSL